MNNKASAPLSLKFLKKYVCCDMCRRYTLKKNEVLKSKLMIGKAFKGGLHFKGRYVHLITYPYYKQMIAFTVTKQQCNAVKRNKLKRILREIYRLHKAEFPCMIAILHAKKTKFPVHFAAVESDVLELIDKINETDQK